MNFSENLKEIQSRIRAKNPNCQLVAVSKKQPFEKIRALYDLGHRDFGENYVQELIEKKTALDEAGLKDIRWHFIGHLQRKKISKIISFIHLIHSVDGLDLAETLNLQAEKAGRSIPVFAQVNISGEASKGGFALDGLEALAGFGDLTALDLRGLMCIPSPEENPSSVFEKMQTLVQNTSQWHQGELSMGMSSDYELAAAAGSNYVRVGTALFGARPG